MEKAFTFAKGATHVDTFNNKRKFGFTLAEVLITLGIIGVVAAMTIPTLVANYQTKSWATASQVFEAKFTEALKTMNVQGQLGKYGKYTTTEGFVEELQKHFKITKVCDNDHLMQCFTSTVVMSDEDVDVSTIKDASGFGQTEWGTNVMGIQFANGVTGLIAYNPKCKSNPYDNTITGADCYALIYDTSGFSDPNEAGKDFRYFGSVNSIANGCFLKIDDLCITRTAFYPTPLTYSECEANKGSGITGCNYDKDYWAGAMTQCGPGAKLPSGEQLAKIANYVLESTDIGADTDMFQIYPVDTKAAELGFYSKEFSIWSDTEGNEYYGSTRMFSSNQGTHWGDALRNNANIQAVCVR